MSFSGWKIYFWRARQHEGLWQRGLRWGKDERSLRLALQIEGYRHIELNPMSAWWVRRWSPTMQQQWFEQMSRLLHKASLIQALKLMPHLGVHPRMGQISRQLLARIEGGSALWRAMQDLQPLFSPMDVALVHAAEETAHLVPTFARMAHEKSQRLIHRRQMTTAMAYPGFLLVVSVGSLWTMSVWVLPSFLKQFAQQANTLPALTQWVLTLGQTVSNLVPVFLLSGLMAWLLPRSMGKSDRVVALRRWVLVRQPRAWWAHPSTQSNWCNTLATALDSGLTLPHALQLAAQSNPHPNWQLAASQITHDVSQGMRLGLAIERSGLFLPLVWHMAELWASSGGGSDLFLQVADELNQRQQRRWRKWAQWSEPLLIMGTGLIMGVMVLAMYLPMFQMGNHW